MLTVLRRVLGRRVSIEALIEVALWLAIPYLLVGVVWAFLHPPEVQQFEAMLLTLVPAGANIIAFGIMVGLWPIMLIAPVLC